MGFAFDEVAAGSDDRTGRTGAPQFTATPYTPNCINVLAEAEHALIGLSPWNSYYKPATIEALIGWACARFDAVDVLLPGYHAAHTLTAGGVEPLRAVHRLRRSLPLLRNPALRALNRSGIGTPQMRVHTWTTLANRPAYANLARRVRQAYRVDEAVRRACRDTARSVIGNVHRIEPTEAQIELAVNYPLAELPFVVDSAAIFGVKSSVLVYHRRMELVDPLVNGSTTTLPPAPGQGFAVVTVAHPVHPVINAEEAP